MIAVVQRVRHARVRVADTIVAEGGRGALALVGLARGDDLAGVRRMAERLLGYRIFADASGRLNRSIVDVGGDLVVVPNFTLVADTRKGTRASFSDAMPPDAARRLFDALIDALRARHPRCAQGVFGAEMAIELVADGPVTFILRT